MTVKFKPLLAATIEDLTKVNYPCCVVEKLDGLRCIIKDGVAYSRSMKPFRSKAVQEKFGKPEYDGLDGELIYGFPTDEDVFNKSTSFCMSGKIPEGMSLDNIRFYAFDRYDLEEPFSSRLAKVVDDPAHGVFRLEHTLVSAPEEVSEFEAKCLKAGYEGIILRSIDGKYKQGRSTLKEGILLKRKIFKDAEFTVVGFKEKMHNQNEASINELGYTERSSCKENLVPANTLGSLTVHNEEFGTFDVGTGFDNTLRKEIWENQDKWIGKLVKVKYFQTDNADYQIRFPVYIGVRHEDDL